MTGAESLLETLANGGLEVCFSNPGTSEMHLVSAIDRSDRIRSILALFEGVATGAADGYGRMAGRPAATLLHLGPGLANGLANLHNARRARSPVMNIVGDHAVAHAAYDAPLTSDVAGVARPMSDWIETSSSPDQLATLGAEALHAAQEPPGRIATLIVPADHAWNPATGPATPLARSSPATVSSDVIDSIARALRSGKRAVLLLGSGALVESGLAAAGRIADATDAEILRETFSARIARGAGRVDAEPLPYFGEAAAARLEKVEVLILIGAKAPVSFFAYPGRPGWLAPKGCEMLTLAEPNQDPAAALEALAEALGCSATCTRVAEFSRPDAATGDLNAHNLATTVARTLPEGAIVSDESATSGFLLPTFTTRSAPHDWLQLTGGAIGQGSPLAIGAAVACPDRRILSLQGDGAAMYTLQALWTQARENLDVTTVILANRSYAILNVEFSRVGLGEPGPKALDMLDLTHPTLDWVKLAEGMGVPAKQVTTAEALEAELSNSFSERGPRLIEAVL
jgi:acetolactate synthase I/II/III large subunit